MVYSQKKGKRFLGKITNFFQIFRWKRIATKAASNESLKKQGLDPQRPSSGLNERAPTVHHG